MNNDNNTTTRYVPSAEAIEAGSRAIADNTLLGDDVILCADDLSTFASAALAAAVPMEVAREVLRLLSEVWAEADIAWARLGASSDPVQTLVDRIREILDDADELWETAELFPGTRDQLGALGVRPTELQTCTLCGWSDCPRASDRTHYCTHATSSDECEDPPSCECASTEATQLACPLHGEEAVCENCLHPWIDHTPAQVDERSRLAAEVERLQGVVDSASPFMSGWHAETVAYAKHDLDVAHRALAQVDEAATGGQSS